MFAPTIANLTASMVASGSVFGQFHHHETSFTSECAGHTWIIVKIVVSGIYGGCDGNDY